MKLSAREILNATDGEWRSPVPEIVYRRVSTDTRQLTAGDLFLALVGERFDGHDFLEDALRRGAGGLVVNRAVAPHRIPRDVPVLEVADTLHALGSIASAWADKCPARRVAVVGSSGKTTTKDMLAAILSPVAPTRATLANRNNRVGVPLTLLDVEPSDQWAVLELGMNQTGELAELMRISDPDLLLLVNVGSAHVGRFGSHDELLHAKAEAIRFLRPDAPIVYNIDCDSSRALVRHWGLGHPIITFSVHQPAEVWAKNILAPPGGPYRFVLETGGREIPIELSLFGRYNVSNAVAAAAGAFALGADPQDIARGLRAFRAGAMRSEVRLVAGTTLILDCYNANPESMMAALDSLAEWGATEGPAASGQSAAEASQKAESPAVAKGRTYLVLGDMLELGEASEEMHRKIGRRIASMSVHGAFAVGDFTPALIEECAPSVALAHHYSGKEDLAAALAPLLRPGDRVFFKGSRANRLESIAERLMEFLQKRQTTQNAS